MRLKTVLIVCWAIAAVLSAPRDTYLAQRIVGQTVTNINQWPQMANILFTWNWSTFEQYCGGTILNNRSVLTAAHCIMTHPPNRFRLRFGSSLASSGGVVRNVDSYIVHPFYNSRTEDHDIAIIRSAVNIVFNNQIQPANIASSDYQLSDNEIVYATGWGAQWYDGPGSEQLHLVQLRTINQDVCARHYSTENVVITDNMLCAGWFDVGGRGQCQGDSGGPLFHNRVVVGIYSFGINCGVRFFPSVNVRVSRVYDWIKANGLYC